MLQKYPTDFTINCILSEGFNEKSQKEITSYYPLNKVGENPWIPKSPFACMRHPELTIFCRSKTKDETVKRNNVTSVISRCQISIKSDIPQSYSQQIDALDYSKVCDKFVLNSLTINLSGDKNQLGFSGESSLSSSPIINYDNNVTNQKCSICLKVFDSLISLDIHEKSHLKQKYECSECNKKFSQLRNYKYHMSIHRGTKEFSASCPECGKIFNDKGYLSSHMKIHRNKKEYLCPYCPKSFNQRVAYNMHCRIHLGLKPHCCSECGKQFSRKMLLKQHFRTHSGEKPYSCSFAGCGKQFADRSNMILHYRLHSGIKPFACHLCPKAFTKKHHLKTHLNYHTGNKPYKCPYCPQKFTQSSNMRTHSKKCQFKTND
ncbi:unnamed protein product [Diamesa tonsa]